MPDAFTTILDGIAAALGEVPGLAVRAEPPDPIAEQDFPAVAIWPEGFDLLPDQVTGRDTWRWSVTLTLAVKADGAAALPGALRAQLATMMATLLADPSLGGLAIDVRWLGGDPPAYLEEGAYTAEQDLALEVDFATPERDPRSLI